MITVIWLADAWFGGTPPWVLSWITTGKSTTPWVVTPLGTTVVTTPVSTWPGSASSRTCTGIPTLTWP